MVLQNDKRNTNQLVISAGGNLGDVQASLSQAKKLIEDRLGEVVKSSSIYKTAAWGVENQPDFLNLVWEVKTDKTAAESLKGLLTIENELGRERKEKWGQRLIDLDILFFNDEIIETADLIVPHPFLHERNFVLIPLVEILPDFVHPKWQKTVSQLLAVCKDQQTVQIL